jgi:hypothetical protein
MSQKRVCPLSDTEKKDSFISEQIASIEWHKENLLDRNTSHYIITQSHLGPCIISICMKNIYQDHSRSVRYAFIMVRTDNGSQRYEIPIKDIRGSSWWKRLFRIDPTINDILCTLNCKSAKIIADQTQDLSNSIAFRLKHSIQLSKDLIDMEEQLITKYQFTLIYIGGQDQNPSFESFILLLKDSESRSCDESENVLEVTWKEYEISFSILQNISQGTNTQYLDSTVILLFNDSGAEPPVELFSKSQVYVILEVVPSLRIDSDPDHNFAYKIICHYKKGIERFPPAIPPSRNFQSMESTRDFILQKCILGERASYKSPYFSKRISKTRATLLYELAIRYSSEAFSYRS